MIDHCNIQLDKLPPDFRDIAETIGLEPTLKLVEARSGESIYVPKVDKVGRAARDRAIRSEFNGTNHRELARKYGLTVVWLRAIVGQDPARPAAEDVIDKQIPQF